MQVVYTNHIGRSEHDKAAKSTNIASASDLAAAEKHNNHNYSQDDVDKMQSAINLELKHLNKHYDENFEEVEYLDLTDRVKQIYKREFADALEEYNGKQKRKDRKIADYFEHVSADGNTDLCVEGIIQIGEMEDWRDLTIFDRERTREIYLDTLKEMLEEVPGLKLAGASFHANESSPHLHWVAVCVHERPNAKKGLKKVASKSAVITPEVLGDIFQTKIRASMERRVEEEFGWTFTDKVSGRNKDYTKYQYANKKLQEENRELETSINQMEERAEELREQIPDWPTYDQEASRAFRLLDQLRDLMREAFSKNFIFRNRKDEKTLLNAVETLRDVIMTSVAALRGFEARERVPERQQRSKVILQALDSQISQAAKEIQPQKKIETRKKEQEH